MKKRLSFLLLVLPLLLTSCGKKEEVVDNTANELKQNDFRGAYTRTLMIQNDVSEVIRQVMESNSSIKEENPSSYWTASGYGYVSDELLDLSAVTPVKYLNEEESTWDESISATKESLTSSDGNPVQNFEAQRLSPNNYVISFKNPEAKYPYIYGVNNGNTETYNATYEPNHDWSQVLNTISVTSKYATNQNVQNKLFEYGRLRDKTYVIQTSTERLFVVYEDNYEQKESTDSKGNIVKDSVLVGDKVSAFYYSKLDGNPLRKYVSYSIENSLTPEELEKATFTDVNPKVVCADGSFVPQYNIDDTMFTHMDSINRNWVTEMGTYSDVLSYHDGKLTAKLQNKLNGKYEVYSFNKKGYCETKTEVIYDNSETLYEDVDIDFTVEDSESLPAASNDALYFSVSGGLSTEDPQEGDKTQIEESNSSSTLSNLINEAYAKEGTDEDVSTDENPNEENDE